MFEITARIANLEQVTAALKRLPQDLDAETLQAIDDALLLLGGDLAEYPGPVPGTRYRRTGLLGQLWSAATHQYRRGNHALEGRIVNARPGVVYVQGEEQATVHRGRWQTAEQVIAQRQGEIDELLRQAGERALARVGG